MSINCEVISGKSKSMARALFTACCLQSWGASARYCLRWRSLIRSGQGPRANTFGSQNGAWLIGAHEAEQAVQRSGSQPSDLSRARLDISCKIWHYCVMRTRDDLDLFIARRTALNPEFPKLMKAAIETRRLVRLLAAERERQGLSQEKVAAALGTKQPNVARLERGAVDPKHTTLVRYADFLGQRITLQPTKRGKQIAASRVPTGSRER